MKLVKPIDGDIKYISDLHFFHDNIIKHCNRPCTQEEHEDWIVNLLNSSISPEDDVYHLGDFSFGSRVKLPELKRVMSRLNGTWHFILGNHDNEKQLEALCAGTKHKVVGFYLSFIIMIPSLYCSTTRWNLGMENIENLYIFMDIPMIQK